MIPPATIRAGMVGLGMIFEETYLPAFAKLRQSGLYRRDCGLVEVPLVAVASRTGHRVARYQQRLPAFQSFTGPQSVDALVASGVDVVCIATPDDRHFEPARTALAAGKHVLIEKPSVLNLEQYDILQELAQRHQVLAKVVYHKLADPDHKKLRTYYRDGVLRHVNNGYCSLLEPKSISGGQFAEWIVGRNPGSYVAIHYIKLIDFTFGPDWKLSRVSCTGQRGLVGPHDGPTWDSTQLRVIYTHPDQREAAFDIHTSWVMPDNFPGYVEQEVQFRFDNGIWNAHQRKRGVEITVEDKSPGSIKYTPNFHYNGTFEEPWGERSQRGYGIEILERFFEEVAYVEFGGARADRSQRLLQMRQLAYNDLNADRNCVAIVHAMESILREHALGNPDTIVAFNCHHAGMCALSARHEPKMLYDNPV